MARLRESCESEVSKFSSEEYQRLRWDAIRKRINGLVNKVSNSPNIKNIILELFAENLIRGRGLFCTSCMRSQIASPSFSHVFAALVSVINAKLPDIGNLLLRRLLVLQMKRAYERNDKPQLLASVKFIAHLVNQKVAHEIIGFELLALLRENPTDDSIEVAVDFVTECGSLSLLQDVSPIGLYGAFEQFYEILNEGEIDKRVKDLIGGLFAIRKAEFQGFPVEEEHRLSHEISLLQEDIDPEITLDIFKPDDNFLENEKKYDELRKSFFGSDVDESEDQVEMKIKEETDTSLINLRRRIYLTIMSSLDFEEADHKLLKNSNPAGTGDGAL